MPRGVKNPAARRISPGGPVVTGNNIGTLTLSATLTSGGNPVSGKTITFSANGRDGGSAITDANGVASVVVSFTPPGAGQKDSAPPDPRPRAPGTYPGGAVANFIGDSIYATATGSNTLIVLPKPK